MLGNGQTHRELNRRRLHEEYERAFIEMRRNWSAQQLEAAIKGGYDKPLQYEHGYHANGNGEDDDFKDPADRAVDFKIPIVDFDSVPPPTLQKFCDDFRSALVWVTRNNGQNGNLTEMGVRMFAVFDVFAPRLKHGMNVRLPRSLVLSLRKSVSNNTHQIGKFFWRPLVWVRKCTSAVQLGKRGYSMIYVLAGDLINSSTCAVIGDLDNKTRQAANKPIQDFRDSFGGIKSLPMRGKITRKRCKNSQEKRN